MLNGYSEACVGVRALLEDLYVHPHGATAGESASFDLLALDLLLQRHQRATNHEDLKNWRRLVRTCGE